MLTPQQFRTIESAGVPVVLYNRTFPDTVANSVRCDHTEGERWLIGKLHEAGHRRFAIVTPPRRAGKCADNATRTGC